MTKALIKNNPFYQIIRDNALSPEQTTIDAMANLLAYDTLKTPEQNERRMKQFRAFNQFLLSAHLHLADEIASFANANAFTETPKALDAMNAALGAFQESIASGDDQKLTKAARNLVQTAENLSATMAGEAGAQTEKANALIRVLDDINGTYGIVLHASTAAAQLTEKRRKIQAAAMKGHASAAFAAAADAEGIIFDLGLQRPALVMIQDSSTAQQAEAMEIPGAMRGKVGAALGDTLLSPSFQAAGAMARLAKLSSVLTFPKDKKNYEKNEENIKKYRP